MALASLLVITTLLALSGMLSPALISVPFLGISVYVVVVRRQITTDARQRTESGSSVEGSNSLYRSKYAELITKVSVRQEHEEWVPLKDRISERESYQSRGITLLPKGSAAAREGWEPIAVPTPSYLFAPAAIQSRRVIDLTNPGAWSLANASRIEEEGRAALAPSPDQIFDQEVAEQVAERIERLRRAN